MTDDGADMSEPRINVAGYSFAANKGAIVCKHVAEGQTPVLGYAHEQDGDIQFVCGAENHPENDWVLVCLSHIVTTHPDLSSLPRVKPGMEARRDNQNSLWVTMAIPSE